jgi:indole-3-glycerol phosphate synthase
MPTTFAFRAMILCKDFTIDPYQIYLARYYQADACLLMLSVLDDEPLEIFLITQHRDRRGVVFVDAGDRRRIEIFANQPRATIRPPPAC